MKLKLILISFILVVLFGCNSDDGNSGSQQLEFNASKLLGKWYLKGGTINGGPFQNYNHKCSLKKDFQEFFANNSVNFTEYSGDCNVSDTEFSGWYVRGNVLTISPFDPLLTDVYEFTIISITSQELKLKIVYEDPEGTITKILTFKRS